MHHTPIGIDTGRLSEFALPAIRFAARPVPDAFSRVWSALADDRPQEALQLVEQILSDAPTGTTKPPLLAARATALFRLRDLDGALRWARQSLEKWPDQWLSTRIVLQVYAARRAYDRAYELLEPFDLEEPASWDAPLDQTVRHMALASWAARCSLWNQAVDHLLEAHPDGASTMAYPLQCDLLRLALTANRADVAQSAAKHVITACDEQQADTVLQTLVHKEWLEEALPLYERLAERSPGTPWIRRRLIGLCLRVGAVERARKVHDQLQTC